MVRREGVRRTIEREHLLNATNRVTTRHTAVVRLAGTSTLVRGVATSQRSLLDSRLDYRVAGRTAGARFVCRRTAALLHKLPHQAFVIVADHRLEHADGTTPDDRVHQRVDQTCDLVLQRPLIAVLQLVGRLILYEVLG